MKIIYLLVVLLYFMVIISSNNNAVFSKEIKNKIKEINKLNLWATPFVKKGNVYSIRKTEEVKGKEYLTGVNDEEQLYSMFAGEKKIKKGNELLKVKWTSTLSIDTVNVEQTELFDKLMELQLAEEDILTVGLLVYRYCLEDEPYDLKAWVSSLPEHYNSAIFYTDEELNYLKGSPAFVQIMIERQSAKELFEKLASTVFKEDLITKNCKNELNWERFSWAYATVSARRIYVPNPESNKPSATIAPYLDFFRRSNEPNANIEYDEELGTVDVRTIANINPKEEIFVNFDHHYCNSELLSDNGYIIKEINSQSCVNVLIEELFDSINQNDPKKQEKMILINNFFEEEGVKMLRISLDSLTEDLLKVSKYIAYKQESVVEYLIRLVELKQSHYLTTIEQDKEFIKTPEYTQLKIKEKLAFDLAFQEKQILSGVKHNLKNNIESSNTEAQPNNQNNEKEPKKVKDEL
ncbi:hypothetical protein DICPUDRAFT_152566 [Dictyostelium purpureum]|uniref:SET domain-containing protein n=1 Tax=Dictyostelium purpureum TaxID=5786 RepID=F0ZLQ0_DICPU|nr:uncharacterized protein DICPUDRAFT_152566 [Dictyostelium purpureum]EGC35153.1 hypothetical protein DICPUDRAFT_152566 [Dictyostelium purpureum]|eukprot:XP_003288346.1 hypothetical protein DICPUDRAFT_152566 [Dictyostelium purpureum]